MPLDIPRPSSEEIERELDELFSPDEPKTRGRKKKDILVCPPMRSRKQILEESFLDPATYTFSQNPQLGDIHEYLMSIWPEEGLQKGDVLEVGFRIAKRPDCIYKMVQVCNALADLAQVGKLRVKRVVSSTQTKHIYGIWEEAAG